MEQETTNRIIRKARGKCWHEEGFHYPYRVSCKNCGDYEVNWDNPNPDYSQWPHYGPMLEWAKVQGWWPDFVKTLLQPPHSYDVVIKEWNITGKVMGFEVLLNPNQGSLAIASYIEENVKEGR